MELMISLGILGVGLSFVATAFPTGMLENKRSVDNTLSTIIAENAVSVCRVKLSHSAIKGSTSATLSDKTLIINNPADEGDLIYPTGSTDTRYGWLILARQPAADDNDYQLAIVPYRKFLNGDPAPTFSSVTVDGTGKKLSSGNKSIGSPVISGADGTYAFVVNLQGDLSGKITAGPAWAVGADGKNSPAIGCYLVRTTIAP